MDGSVSIRRSPVEAALSRVIDIPDSPTMIDLSVGEPDIVTPPRIVEAGIEALRAGHTHYTARRGEGPLRDLIVEKLRRKNGIEVGRDDLIVTSGGGAAVTAAIGGGCRPGDSILIPDPGWPNYELFSLRMGVRPRRYRQDPSADVAFDLEEIESLIDDTTRMIVITSPSNPTGGMASPELVRELVELAERHDLLICSDEAYEDIVFEGRPTSPAAVGGADRTFACFTFSKTYAMTGWRIGYVVVPPRFDQQAFAMQVTTSGSAPTVAQKAAEAALAEEQPEVTAAIEAYGRRREAAASIAEAGGLLRSRPAGAFYLWLDIGRSGLSGQEFTSRLARDHDVLVSAGEVYSELQSGHVRVSYATADDLVTEGMNRLVSAVDGLAAAAR
ncbi:MAG: pyridoxal phosphate-dependent aminotransferase [Actinobacteria bacterium]|nr:pyridoxal phosphate-dependent aminotransferase [Actinomycetota bacterium]